MQRYLSGELGRFLHGSGLYTRGVLNNGSHLIDLFQWVLGEPKGLRKTREFVDHDPSDPNVEFVLEFDQAAVHIGCGVGKLYHVFEYAFYFENEAFPLGYTRTSYAPLPSGRISDVCRTARLEASRSEFVWTARGNEAARR